MTISQRLLAQLLVALNQRDWDTVDDLVGDAAEELGGEQEALDYFRAHVIATASRDTREAFWRHAMGERYPEFIENMIGACTARLETMGFVLGSDYSVGPEALFLTKECRDRLQEFYSPGQFASMEIILRCPDV